MDNTKLEEIVRWWGKSYFTLPILLSCIMLCLYLGIKHFKKDKIHALFLVYALLGAILCPGLDIIIYPKHSGESDIRTKFVETGNLVFAITEFAAFMTFFGTTIINKIALKIIRIQLPVFILIVTLLIFLIHNDTFTNSQIKMLSFRTNSIEFLLLLYPCLVSFYEELKREHDHISIFHIHPNIWISVGLFIYIIISFPFIFIGDYLSEKFDSLYRLMFSIHFISISFLFLCLAKSFSCKVKTTK